MAILRARRCAAGNPAADRAAAVPAKEARLLPALFPIRYP
jgi:hypothetical protein